MGCAFFILPFSAQALSPLISCAAFSLIITVNLLNFESPGGMGASQTIIIISTRLNICLLFGMFKWTQPLIFSFSYPGQFWSLINVR